MNKLASLVMGLILGTCVFAETKQFEVNGIKFNMVYVEGGSFSMGSFSSDREADADEMSHRVVLTNYYIGETEVTQALWSAVMSKNPSYFKSDSMLPVERISYIEAKEFVDQLNLLTHESFCLPTEAEWEYAAKGGNNHDKYLYSGSAQIDSVAFYGNTKSNLKQSATDATYPVGSKRPNSLGVYDMSGNVYEWCSDWYYRYYPSETEVNPKGPEKGDFRVVRGGCWSSDPFYCRTSKRVYASPRKKYSNIGMRLCLRK